MHPKHLSIHNFTYQLPEEKIARFPLPERDASKLLVYKNEKITEDCYTNLHTYIPENAVLVFNNTKVVEARILFSKPGGASIEIFCLEPHEQYPDISTAMMEQKKVWWKCLVGGASKWKPGQVLQKEVPCPGEKLVLNATCIEKRSDGFVIELSWMPEKLSFAAVLHYAGLVPLPPYIKRAAEASDNERYQTIYAMHDGSVAAPTAGLHFTDAVFDKLTSKHIQKLFVTLHVGAGTFKPVKSVRLEGHDMHAEYIDVSRSAIDSLINHLSGNIIAVGTTSLRTLESLYWLGLKTILQPGIAPAALFIQQWDPYELRADAVSAKEALLSLTQWMDIHQPDRLITKTQLLITPGYRFRIIKGLITNFHQPQSTLLLLVAALVGHSWKELYRYALDHNFRFLSYGDGCLLFRKED